MKMLVSSKQFRNSNGLKRALGVGALLGSVVLAPIARSAAIGLTGAGATFPYPIYSKWFDVYQKTTGVAINYQSIGSGGGIQQLKNGTVDFGASDAPLKAADEKAMPGQVVHIPTVAGAVAIAYKLPGMGSGLHLSGDVLAGIFLGQIRRWNDPRIAALNHGKALPGTAIAVAHRSDGSGTTNIFTTYLKTVSPAWASKVGAGKSVNWPVGIGGKGSEGVAAVIGQTPGAIGYVELAYAVQNHLSYAFIRNRAGAFVSPSVASVTAAAAASSGALRRDVRASIVNAAGARSYPISGFTYILVYQHQRDAAKGRAVVGFLRWAIHGGQRYASPLLYAPLPAAIVALDDAKLKSIH